jgi:hypothetical protein
MSEGHQGVDSVGQPSTHVGRLTQEPVHRIAMSQRRVDSGLLPGT